MKKHLFDVEKVITIINDGKFACFVLAIEDKLIPMSAFVSSLTFSMRAMIAWPIYDLSVVVTDYVTAVTTQCLVSVIFFPDIVAFFVNRDRVSQVFAGRIYWEA